jgi:hypothetical protein
VVKLNFDLTHNQFKRYFILCTYLVNNCKCWLLLIFSDNFVIVLPALHVSGHDLRWLQFSLSVFTNNYLPFLLGCKNHSVVNLILNKHWLSQVLCGRTLLLNSISCRFQFINLLYTRTLLLKVNFLQLRLRECLHPATALIYHILKFVADFDVSLRTLVLSPFLKRAPSSTPWLLSIETVIDSWRWLWHDVGGGGTIDFIVEAVDAFFSGELTLILFLDNWV